MITITESAREKLIDLLVHEQNYTALRIFVQGGGCSGFQYGFEFTDTSQDDDFTIDIDNYRILIDSISMQYLQGAELDWVQELMGSSFTLKNPNAQTTCGCGSSFSI